MAEPLHRIPGFAVYLVARFMIGLILRGVAVAVGFQIYEITSDPIALGYIGLALFLPIVIFGLVAGDIADRVNKAVMLAVATFFMGIACAGLLVLSYHGVSTTWPFYAFTVLFGTALAFSRPPQPSLVPQLVGPAQTPNGVAVSSAIGQSATILGPPLAGALLIAGPVAAYATMTAIAAATAVAWLMVAPHARPGTLAGSGLSIFGRIAAGFATVVRAKLILGAMSLDLFAVLLGGVMALLPIFARDILMVGPFGLGLLRAAPAAGATLIAVAMARLPSPANSGHIIFGGVAAFGASIVVFGLSENLYLSLAALFVSGASDMISNILRNSAVQLASPRASLGRVNAVNQVFISGANELGDFRAGVSAGLLGTVPAVVIGGVGAMAVAGLWAWLFPSLRTLGRLADIKPVEEAPGPSGSGKSR